MDPAQYIFHIAIAASSWMAGIFLARFLMRKFFKINPDGPESVPLKDGDVLEFDKADQPYVPVKVIVENDLFYAWYSNNNKFIGQAATLDEIRAMAHEHLLKIMGLRFEFTEESEAQAQKSS